MVALEIAAFCEVQGDEIGFEVVDGSAVVGRRSRGCRSKELRHLLLDGAERSRQCREIENRQRPSHQWLAPDFDEPVRFAIISLRLPVFMASAM